MGMGSTNPFLWHDTFVDGVHLVVNKNDDDDDDDDDNDRNNLEEIMDLFLS